MRVRDLLEVPGLGLRLLTDVTGLDRAIKHVYTTDLPDPGRYLTAGDLVLTGMVWCREPGDAERFVTVLAKAGTAVLGAGEALGQVPSEVIQACGRHGLTLLAVPPETSFAVVTEEAGLDEMFRLMSREIGAECWLLTPMGRVVGGTGLSLPGPVALGLAGKFLQAGRLPAVTEVTGPGGGTEEYSLFGVGGEPRITSWFLACPGREHGWSRELRESVAELAADVALERARLDASRTGDRKLAEAIITMLASGGAEGSAPLEIASLMRALGRRPDGGYLVAALCVEAARVAGPDTDRWRRPSPGWRRYPARCTRRAARGGSPRCARRRP